ncbi:nucleoside-diphosphate kinase [Pectinatus haikarae]|uniref:Nucleoside diphosphate kinase n=1 Tax=Pectinatus haikarae TaxID=349096 RepID=A0ABT9Y4V0_9FIRM|nr:nucleoside-diphosphate kinase [Pectinatus haikarae]MDQ0202751.1 nucleoside-diphosphate kinase [Pectinatus haikarae]
MAEKTLILIKPDAVKVGNTGKILSIYEASGLKIVALRMLVMTRELAAKHYEEHIGKTFYSRLVDFMTSGPLAAAVLEGETAVAKARAVNGATDPLQAEAGTIRKLFAEDKTHNAVHASDSVKNAEREISIFFSEAEIFDI